jgi:hypothetical protein
MRERDNYWAVALAMLMVLSAAFSSSTCLKIAAYNIMHPVPHQDIFKLYDGLSRGR